MISQDWFDRHLPEMIAIRRDIHANPELGLEEVRTSQVVCDQLDKAGIEYERHIGQTGVVATIKGEKPGPTIGLRADMDALDIIEDTGLPYASTNGHMHACGHDGHTTMLLTAGRWLSENRNFAGIIHLIFQPAEEGKGGADAMISDGLFEKFPCDAIFGLHNTPGMPVGGFGTRDGEMMASAGEWNAVFTGTGGHGGAAPQLTQDVTYAMAHFVLGLQGIIGRQIAPTESATLSIGHINCGSPEAFNVVPTTLSISGTMRCFKHDVGELLIQRLKETATAAAAMTGCSAKIQSRIIMPPLVNDSRCYEIALNSARKIVSEDLVQSNYKKTTGSEDFASMMQIKPGAFMRIGNGSNPDGSFQGLHTPMFDFNDDIIGLGAEYWVTVAHEAMSQLGNKSAKR